MECGGVGDLLAVDGDHAGSAEVLGAMYEKQLKSMGCPHWVRSTEQKSFQSAKGGFSVVLSLSVVFATDSGGDETI